MWRVRGSCLTVEQVTAVRRLVRALVMHVLELHRGQFGYGQIRQIRRTKRGNGRMVFRGLLGLGREVRNSRNGILRLDSWVRFVG